MGGVYGTHVGEGECIQSFGVEIERRHLKTLGPDGRMILRCNKNVRWEGIDIRGLKL